MMRAFRFFANVAMVGGLLSLAWLPRDATMEWLVTIVLTCSAGQVAIEAFLPTGLPTANARRRLARARANPSRRR